MSPQSCIASIDQGTSSTRVLLINASGKVVGSHQVEHKQYYPASGEVEHDPLEIWNSVKVCLSEALKSAKTKIKVVSIGITNQRETSIVWNKKTGLPYHRAIVWNDSRTSDICEKLAENGGKDRFREKTGLPIATYFSATKLLHMLECVDELRDAAEKGEALFGTIDTWIIWKLTNGRSHVTDVTNASRTLLMNLKTLNWDDEILKELNIPKKMLPAIHPSSHLFGHADTFKNEDFAEHPMTSNEAEAEFEHSQNVPINGVIGDQNAALFGQVCFQPGDTKCTYGTGAFLLMNTGNEIIRSNRGLLTTLAYQLVDPKTGKPAPPVYALEGAVAYSGSVLQWLRDNLKIIESAKETEEIARSVPSNEGVYFVPAFNGLFAPYWREDARGIIAGLTAYHTRAHVVRAALEASAFQTVDMKKSMWLDRADAGYVAKDPPPLRVDGGVTANSTLMQFQSDVLDLPLVKPEIVETTAMGAAYVAGLGVGLWKDIEDVRVLWQKGDSWQPGMLKSEREEQLHNWKKAVDKSIGWVERETKSLPETGKITTTPNLDTFKSPLLTLTPNLSSFKTTAPKTLPISNSGLTITPNMTAYKSKGPSAHVGLKGGSKKGFGVVAGFGLFSVGLAFGAGAAKTKYFENNLEKTN